MRGSLQSWSSLPLRAKSALLPAMPLQEPRGLMGEEVGGGRQQARAIGEPEERRLPARLLLLRRNSS